MMALSYHPPMPLLRCQKCGQAYDVPPVIAIRLTNAIATCHCGEWLAGSKAAVLARMMNPDEIREIDLQPYRTDRAGDARREEQADPQPAANEGTPRSVRIITRGAAPMNAVFTIGRHPLWIGRQSSHIELDDAELSIRHCSISLRGDKLIVRDADSHTGTFLDGEAITEKELEDGVHLLRIGTALLSIEPSNEVTDAVGPMSLQRDTSHDSLALMRKLQERARAAEQAESARHVLVCIDGPMKGQEFEVPPTGLTVGREGHVRVADEYLSRKHFEVVPDEEGAIRVRDLDSRNGTFLNTLPARNTRVQAGDEIKAGVHTFRIERR